MPGYHTFDEEQFIQSSSSTEEEGGGFWDWWSNHGDDVVGIANDASDMFCTFFPNSKRCDAVHEQEQVLALEQQRDNSILYIVSAFAFLILIILILKK